MNREQLKQRTITSMNQQIWKKGTVSSLDVLLDLGWIHAKDVENWRKGQIPCLERVVHGNLSQLNVMLETMRRYAADQHWKASWTCFMGGRPRRQLQFSKSGAPAMEKRYSTVYVSSERV